MDRGQFALELFGKDVVPTLHLRRPLPAVSAVAHDEGGFTAEGHTAPTVCELCQALVASGTPDVAMQIRWPDRSPAMFVDSIHSVAREAQ